MLMEEAEGGTITLHNLTHLTDDIHRFSSPDNYWCFAFERAVRKYVEQSSNQNNLEATFAKFECRREVLKFNKCTDLEEVQHSTNQVCIKHIYYLLIISNCMNRHVFDSVNLKYTFAL